MNFVYYPLMDCQVLLNLLSVSKLRYGGTKTIIVNQGLDRKQICGGGIGNNNQSFKLSLKILIVPHMLRRGALKGANCK